ncbi:hypothetical protein Egran_02603 [Elaphomyces granulatus]|uniref:UNC-45/Cro1/She4 central domain-containing protein n=1 Tax=Elaphomyces granulatus TaxID=519963 RepID=A0A232M019_9EURO|nr:hypothetical protein Egran_02603 [Elaphomyces granulatus]
MVQPGDEQRALHLSREAIELADAGHCEAASRNLREAISLAPDSIEVQAAFQKVRGDDQSRHPLLDLCRRYVSGKDENAGKEAVRFLCTDGLKPTEDAALESLKLILMKRPNTLSPTQDDIISGLVRHNLSVRQLFASRLHASVTTFFDEIYDRGDGAVVGLDTVVLDPTLWPSEDARLHCESDLFQLFIAKLMESGHDLDGRSLKGITRLLAVDSEKLQHLVDDDSLDVILSSLDNRLSMDVRSQATLATAKYIEAAKDVGEQRFSKLIRAKVRKHRNDDLVIAFSATAAVFPVVPQMIAPLFLTQGFLQSVVSLLNRQGKSHSVEIALLELFSAACVDQACREAIDKYCTEWLSHILSNGSESGVDLAAVILAKVRASEKDGASGSNGKVQEEASNVHELVDRFKGLMSKSKASNLHNPIEGLAFSSVKPNVKEQIAEDSGFLKDIFDVLRTNISDTAMLYGGLMIISNLTKYPPILSEEQKKMSELKAYANATKGSVKPNPLDNDQHVTARCQAVIEAGVMPLLVECGKTSMTSIQTLLCKILLSLSKNPKTRGKLAQQGIVKLLLSILGTKSMNLATAPLNETIYHASHALARVLISVNPAHVFPYSGFPQITSAVRPLVRLLSPPETSSGFSVDQPRDLLPIFESLLALTNLASSPDDSAAEAIIRQAWSMLDDLFLSNNTFIQRATCELVCNLMTCESGIVKFADGSKRASQRLHVLLALTDADDIATRRAAGGALAMLTEYDATIAAVLECPRGVNLLLGLCQESNDDLTHRGIVCMRNMTCIASGDIGARARDAVRQVGAVDTLKGCLQRTSNPVILQAGMEALKPLVEQSAG